MNKINIVSLFSGVGAFETALTRLGIEHEIELYSEIDRFASKAYSVLHNVDESLNIGSVENINKVNTSEDITLLTYGFPCQDISIAGYQRGLTDEQGNKTRSGLVWDALKVVDKVKPKIAIAENVKGLVGKKFEEEFKAILDELDFIGYNNYWKVLNAKDYGVAQNRERVFIVSIRKDIDTGLFEWPEPFKLTKSIKDYLEAKVDKKYYISTNMVAYLTGINQSEESKAKYDRAKRFSPHIDGSRIAYTITTNTGNRPTDNYILESTPLIIKDKEEFYKQLEEYGSIIGAYRGRDLDNLSDRTKGIKLTQVIEPNLKGVSNTLTTVPKDNYVIESNQLRLRKLTPLECWRLMGFDDEDHNKVEQAGISNSQRYKQAGNSIVVDVLEYLLKNIFESQHIIIGGIYEKVL